MQNTESKQGTRLFAILAWTELSLAIPFFVFLAVPFIPDKLPLLIGYGVAEVLLYKGLLALDQNFRS